MPEGSNVGLGVAFMVSFMMVYDTMSTTNSSPQTTEINANTRAESLMKWVYLGLAQAAAIAVIAVVIEPDANKKAAIGGGAGIAIVSLWGQYTHAKRKGLESMAPGTESY